MWRAAIQSEEVFFHVYKVDGGFELGPERCTSYPWKTSFSNVLHQENTLRSNNGLLTVLGRAGSEPTKVKGVVWLYLIILQIISGRHISSSVQR